jgi:hypothetical protein
MCCLGEGLGWDLLLVFITAVVFTDIIIIIIIIIALYVLSR